MAGCFEIFAASMLSSRSSSIFPDGAAVTEGVDEADKGASVAVLTFAIFVLIAVGFTLMGVEVA